MADVLFYAGRAAILLGLLLALVAAVQWLAPQHLGAIVPVGMGVVWLVAWWLDLAYGPHRLGGRRG